MSDDVFTTTSTLASLRAPDGFADADVDATHVVTIDPITESGRRSAEAITTVATAGFGVRALPGNDESVSWPATFAAGCYTGDDVPTLLHGPIWTAVHIEPGLGWTDAVELDLRTGVVRHELRHEASGSIVEVVRFVSAADAGIGVQVTTGPQEVVVASDPLRSPPQHDVSAVFVAGAEVMSVRDPRSGSSIAAAAHDDITDLATNGKRRTLTRLVGLAADRVGAADVLASRRLAAARRLGAGEIDRRHRATWQRRWEGCGTWITERPDLELAIRFATHHLLCCDGAEHDDEVAIGARGLTGTAYRGHVFWDTDVFVVPALSAIAPRAARRALNYRWARLSQARARAAAEGRQGARFPWESAGDGSEVTPRFGRDLSGRELTIRTGELEEHITADIAWAIGNHVAWTGDDDFLKRRGLDILVESARYWTSRVEVDSSGSGHLTGLIGPDEYHEAVDDNVFTNVMVRHNLLLSADTAERLDACDADEVRYWRHLADQIVDGFDPELGLYEQFVGYRNLSSTAASSIANPPLSADVLLGQDVIQTTQIIKQPDVLMAYHLVPELLRPDAFEQNLDYYALRTAHGSSLSPAIMASLMFRAKRWNEAIALFEFAARLDLEDTTGTTAGGLHLATMGGLWQAVTCGLLGMRTNGAGLTLDPRVPEEFGRLRHRVMFRGSTVVVTVSDDTAVVESTSPLTLCVGGDTRIASRHRVAAVDDGWEHR